MCIRVKKDQVGNLLCYIIGVVTMPQRRLENKFDMGRPHQSSHLKYMFEDLSRVR
nr:MAG TPA: hypothetical protein [Caudoviricetes sp.]DAR65521.1 MAG TPA: hypothetical protein [Caudoviricetes sp.]